MRVKNVLPSFVYFGNNKCSEWLPRTWKKLVGDAAGALDRRRKSLRLENEVSVRFWVEIGFFVQFI